MSEIDISTLISTYEKFKHYQEKMKEANKRYRSTERGREKAKIVQQRWLESKKGDDQYRQIVNEKQKERYRRKVEAIKNAKSCDLSKTDIIKEV